LRQTYVVALPYYATLLPDQMLAGREKPADPNAKWFVQKAASRPSLLCE
jgi:hypothetical protein